MATDYLALSKDAFDASTTYLESNYRADLEYSLRAFRNEHAPGSKYNSEEFKARSRFFRPKTRSIIRKNEAAAMQAAFSNREIVHCEAGNPDDVMSVASAAALKEILEYRLTKTIPTYQVYLGGVQDAQTTGVVCSYQYWEYQTAPDGRKIKDRPCIELRPIENIRLDNGASWLDPIGTSPYFCDIIPMYVCDVKAMMNSRDEKTGTKWKKYDDKIIAMARPQAVDSLRQARLGNKQDPTDETQIRAFDTVWALRWFMKDSQGEDQHYYTLGTEKMLSEVKPLQEVYFHGKRPYVMGYAILETHRVLKSGVPLLIKPLQMETTDLANQRMDNVKFVLNKRWLVARGRQVDVQSLVRNVPGGVTLLTDPKNDVVESNWQDVTSSAYVEQDRLSSDIDDLAGNFSPSTKVANNAVNDTLGGSKMAAAGAGLMSDYLIRTVNETWWEPVIRQLALLEQYYESDEIILSVCAQKARLFPRFGISKITDSMLINEVNVNVDMALGDPNQRLQKFLMATNAAMQMVSMAPPGYNVQEGIKEIYANAGYRDGSRFWNMQQDPRLMKAMQMVQQLQGALQGKQLEMQSTQQIEGAKIQSNERIKMAEIRVNAIRIDGDLKIRQSELQIEAQKVELEKLKIASGENQNNQELQLRIAEMQANITEGEKKLEHDRLKLAADIARERESAIRDIEKIVTTHQLKLAGMLEVEAEKRKTVANQDDIKARQKDSETSAKHHEAAAKMNQELGQTLAEALKALKAPRSIELIKKDGETVGASVT